MPCINGRINPNLATKLRLFADSAGYCQRANCGRRLFSDESGEDYHIAEMAHIFAAVNGGPRSPQKMSSKERAHYRNLILLCPNCHTEIDKAPTSFTDKIIEEWKSSHKETIKAAIGVVKFKSRTDIQGYLLPLFAKNKTIFTTHGPSNSYHENPEAEEAVVWKRKMLSQIIPNNQQILLAIDTNLNLFDTDEQVTVELFRQHLDDLIERHLGENSSIASRFPSEIIKLFEQPDEQR